MVRKSVYLFTVVFLATCVLVVLLTMRPRESRAQGSMLQIGDVQSNSAVVGRFEEFELTFNVTGTVATNLDWPYDPDPPAGLPAGTGITVDGLFSPDGWTTVYTQPAFLYQPYTYTVRGDWDHLYPSGDPVWKIRFAAPATGLWHYRIQATDASGTVIYPISGGLTLTVQSSVNPGFLHVSPNDSRYFEFSDGSPFIGVGHAEGFDRLRMIQDASEKLSRFASHRVNFSRVWMSSYSIFGSAWWPWSSHHLPYEGYLPATGLTFEDVYAGGDVSMKLDTQNPCMRQGKYPVAVLPETTYRVRVRVKTVGISQDQAGESYGFVAKLGGWLDKDCNSPSAGTPVTPYVTDTGSTWQIVTGTITTAADDYFLFVSDNFYLTLANVDDGVAYIDEVWLEEQTGPGAYGPNIMPKPRMNAHTYIDPVRSWQWDQILDDAAANGVYLKLVVLEKNEWIFNRITSAGSMTDAASNNNFYAAPDTKVRWLHQAWWRYLIARWSYSTAVHSWELVNEGDPFNGNHYSQAQAFARYVHENDPNAHMVTTSFWHSYPMDEFWANPTYPDIDYADLHAYVSTGWGKYQVIPDTPPFPLSYTSESDYDGSGWGVELEGSDHAYSLGLWKVDIQGNGEWILRYRLRLNGWSGSCSQGDELSGPRLIWWLWGIGGDSNRNVVPPRADGEDWRCSTPVVLDKWLAYDSAHTACGEAAPLEARIIITDSLPHRIEIGIQNSFGTAGTAYFDAVELLAPDGSLLPINGGIDLSAMHEDAALYTSGYSMLWGGQSPAGAGKPLVRGEGGLDHPGGPQEELADLAQDTEGVWLHNFVWGGVNAGGMYDLYWWIDNIRDFDLYSHYKAFRNFMDGIPISNGNYEDARASAPAGLRAFGQADRVNNRGHLWVQNTDHTWRNVVDGVSPPGRGGTVGVPNVLSGTYRVTWWDTWAGDPAHTSTVDSPFPSLVLSLPYPITDDIALQWERIGPSSRSVVQVHLPVVLRDYETVSWPCSGLGERRSILGPSPRNTRADAV